MGLTVGKHELGLLFNNQDMLQSANQEMNEYLDTGKQLYQYAKQTWQDKSKLERYELIGNIATDFLFSRGLSVAGKLAPITNLAQYKPQTFAKLGQLGQEINQIAGLACVKGVKKVQQSLDTIQKYPRASCRVKNV